tara:strand:- start:26 stop:439 length:414 start_codon:yes stop_codon:yes gene_type:complete
MFTKKGEKMKKTISLSYIHVIIAIAALFFGVSSAKSQSLPNIPEMVPYSLTPMDYDPDCVLELGIALLHPYSIDAMEYDIQKRETLEIFYERISFEVVNPDQQGTIFKVDDKAYVLVRIPYTAPVDNWYHRAMNHSE